MTEHFYVEPNGSLVRTVVPGRSRHFGGAIGEPYIHTCPLAVLEGVAQVINEAKDRGVTLDELVATAKFPHSQANVALSFLKERGTLVPVRGRRHAAAVVDVYLDAMLEYHALREKGAGEAGAAATD